MVRLFSEGHIEISRLLAETRVSRIIGSRVYSLSFVQWQFAGFEPLPLGLKIMKHGRLK